VIRRNVQGAYDAGYWDGAIFGVVVAGCISFWIIVLIAVVT